MVCLSRTPKSFEFELRICFGCPQHFLLDAILPAHPDTVRKLLDVQLYMEYLTLSNKGPVLHKKRKEKNLASEESPTAACDGQIDKPTCILINLYSNM